MVVTDPIRFDQDRLMLRRSEMQMSDEIDQIATALAAAQAELEGAKKDSSGYGYNYSDLATVINSAKPILAKHSLAVVQLVGEQSEDKVSVTTILTHSSGQYFRSTASLPLVDMKGCNKAQEAGASLSYLRRYAYQSIIGQPSEDNDASSEGKPKTSSSFKKKANSTPPSAEKKTTKTTASKPNFRKKAKTSSGGL